MNSEENLNLWFFVEGLPYKGNEPDFINVTKFAWAQYLENNYKAILNELTKFLNTAHSKNIFKPYFNSNLVNEKRVWKTIPVMIWGIVSKKIRHFPTLQNFINEFPEVVSLSFNKLEPGGKIMPHQGDTNGIYRIHLGLKVNEGLPKVGFRVNRSMKEWHEGKVFAFCDAHEHEAWNLGNRERIILSVDIIRPEFIEQKNSICIKVRAFLALQLLVGKFPFLLKTPKILVAPVFIATSFVLKIPFFVSKLLKRYKAQN